MNYFFLYREVWNFHKKYSNVVGDNQYWESVTSEGSQLTKKYNEHPFVIALLTAVISELERVGKEKR